MIYGNGDDSITVNPWDGTIQAGDGNDTINCSGLSTWDTVTLYGEGGDDIYDLYGRGTCFIDVGADDPGTDTIIVHGFSYTLPDVQIENLTLTGTTGLAGVGNSLDNIITGTTGNDTLDGQEGSDVLIGGDGNDIYFVDTITDTITDVSGNDTVFSSVSYTLGANIENLTLTGTSGLTGAGNSSDNIITGTGGNDILYGGSGNDTYQVSAGFGDDVIIENGNDTMDVIRFTGMNKGINGSNLSYGRAGTDMLLFVAGQTGSITLKNWYTEVNRVERARFDDGDINLNNQCNNQVPVVTSPIPDYRAFRNNIFFYTISGDTFYDPEGKTLTYSATLDDGSALPAWLVFDPVTLTLKGMPPAERTYPLNLGIKVIATDPDGLRASASFDLCMTTNIITGTSISESIGGTSFDDEIYGLGGRDTLNGGAGIDSLIGGGGNDTYIVDSTSDIITEIASGDIDTIRSSISFDLGSDIQYSNIENLTLTGTTGLAGTGNASNNIITGASGNDTLDGASGNDTLYGGSGNDTYQVSAGFGNDVIIENGGSDVIRFAGLNKGTNDANVTISRSGNDMTIAVAGQTGLITLQGWYASAGNTVEIARFDDGDITLSQSNQAPTVITPIQDSEGRRNNAYSYTIPAGTFSDPEGSTLTYTATQGDGSALPAWLTFDAATRTFTGTPPANATYPGNLSIKVTATDIGGLTASDTFTLSLITNIINGSGIDETLGGTGYRDEINGLAGFDTLYGGGFDTLIGGIGNDTYYTDGTDVIIEDNAIDSDIINSSGNYTLSDTQTIEGISLIGTALNATGNKYDNYIIGNSGNNLLIGAGGNDALRGNGGYDTLIGGTGDDNYFIDNGEEILDESTGGGGTDTVYSSISYTLQDTNIENLTLLDGAYSNDNATGNTVDNVITGNSRDNILVGLDGKDTIYGYGGNNTLIGGTGDDYLDGASHSSPDTSDSLVGGAGSDTYVVNSEYDEIVEITGEGSKDAVFSYAASYTLADNVEDLTLTGSDAIGWAESGTGTTLDNILTGNDRDNTLYGLAGNDTLIGGGGNDTLWGGDGNDILIGGTGNDTYILDSTSDTITEDSITGGGTDTVLSSVSYTLGTNIENLTLTGTSGLTGAGNSSDNIITSTGGNDTLIGGSGNDTYQVSAGFGNDVIIENGGSDIIRFAGLNKGDLTHERVGDDMKLWIAGQTGSITLQGWYVSGGANRVEKAQFEDGFVYLDGFDNNAPEVIVGGIPDGEGRRNNLYSYTIPVGTFYDDDGDNLTYTATLSDGTALPEWLTFNADTQTFTGTPPAYITDKQVLYITVTATDLRSPGVSATFTLSLDTNIMNGTDGNDSLIGTKFNDEMYGVGGNDTLDAITGSDSLTGGTGNDTYYVDQASDIIFENAGGGTDIVFSSALSYTLADNVEKITLTGTLASSAAGNSSNNTIYGNGADNTLYGLDGNDYLCGGDGNDALYGGVGNDNLRGELGLDTLYGGDGDDKYYVSDVLDIIVEYYDKGIDTIYSDVSYTLGDNIDNLKANPTNNFIYGVGNALDNSITGNDSDNTLIGQAGNDDLKGYDGNDTYIFSIGDGQDVITENGSDAGYADIILFTGDITRDDITIWENSAKDLYISYGSAGDTVCILSQDNAQGMGGIEEIRFSDGTILTNAAINAIVSGISQYNSSNSGTITGTGNVPQYPEILSIVIPGH